MSADSEFQLQPERQELDLKGFSDPHVLSWIYGGVAWTVLVGYVSIEVTDSLVVDLAFYLLLGVTLLLILLQITGVVIAFIGKKAAFKRINRANMSVRIDDGSFTFTQENEPVFVIPLDDIDRIEVLVDKRELMLGPGTGYNVVTRSYEQNTEEASANVSQIEEDGEEKYQFWLDSRAIGTNKQIEAFHRWLEDHGLDENMVFFSQEATYNWSTADWIWLVVHTLLLVATIGYAISN